MTIFCTCRHLPDSFKCPKSLLNNDNEQMNEAIGKQEAEALKLLGRFGRPVGRLDELAHLAGPQRRAALHETLRRLVQKGILVRITRGRYAEARADPNLVACLAFPPSYVSFLNVLAEAGFTEQIPRRLDAAYAQTRLRRLDWNGLTITWHPIPPEAFVGYATRPDGVLVATPAKAAADLVHRQRDFGGILGYRSMVTQALRDATAKERREAIGAYGAVPGTRRRLLYLAGEEAPADLDARNPIPLDLGSPKGQVQGGGLRIIDPESA